MPSRAEKFQLQDAGLGRKTIVFNLRDQAIAFVEKLESIYPKLKDASGFELLRSGPSNKDLVVITPPASGYSVPFLRESSGLGQAVAYVRPLQKSLSTAAAASAQGLFEVRPLYFVERYYNLLTPPPLLPIVTSDFVIRTPLLLRKCFQVPVLIRISVIEKMW